VGYRPAVAADPPVRPPDLAELRALSAAVRRRSIGAAARELGVSQPALSKRLRQLETVVGLPLLERSPRGVTPTDAGRQVLFAAERVLDELAELERTVLQLRGRPRSLRLAASAAIAESLLPSMLTTFHARAGREPVELIVCNSTLVRELIASGRADVGIAGSGPDEDAGRHVLAEDELLLAVPEGHPWREVDAVPAAELGSTRLILRDPGSNQRLVAAELLERRGIALAEPFREVTSTAEALRVLAEARVPALVSRLSVPAAPGVTLRPVDPPLRRRFVVLVAPGHVSPGVERLVQALRS
jgi:DNA-binding transcriptional LysR family regulator